MIINCYHCLRVKQLPLQDINAIAQKSENQDVIDFLYNNSTDKEKLALNFAQNKHVSRKTMLELYNLFIDKDYIKDQLLIHPSLEVERMVTIDFPRILSGADYRDELIKKFIAKIAKNQNFEKTHIENLIKNPNIKNVGCCYLTYALSENASQLMSIDILHMLNQTLGCSTAYNIFFQKIINNNYNDDILVKLIKENYSSLSWLVRVFKCIININFNDKKNILSAILVTIQNSRLNLTDILSHCCHDCNYRGIQSIQFIFDHIKDKDLKIELAREMIANCRKPEILDFGRNIICFDWANGPCQD